MNLYYHLQQDINDIDWQCVLHQQFGHIDQV